MAMCAIARRGGGPPGAAPQGPLPGPGHAGLRRVHRQGDRATAAIIGRHRQAGRCSSRSSCSGFRITTDTGGPARRSSSSSPSCSPRCSSPSGSCSRRTSWGARRWIATVRQLARLGHHRRQPHLVEGRSCSPSPAAWPSSPAHAAGLSPRAPCPRRLLPAVRRPAAGPAAGGAGRALPGGGVHGHARARLVPRPSTRCWAAKPQLSALELIGPGIAAIDGLPAATAASDALPRATWTRFPHWKYRRSVMASTTSSASSIRLSATAGRWR